MRRARMLLCFWCCAWACCQASGIAGQNGAAEEVFLQGIEQTKSGQLDPARQSFEHSLKLETDFTPAKLALDTLKDVSRGALKTELAAQTIEGIRLAHLARWEEALAAFAAVAASQPGYARIHALQANVLVIAGEHRRALEEYDLALQYNPASAGIYNDRGITYAAIGSFEQAVQDLSRALQIDPTYKMAYINRGHAYVSLQRFDDALADYGAAADIDPGCAEAYFNRGSVLFAHKQDYRQAAADFTRVIGIDKKDTDAYYNRGLAYASQGMFEQAIYDFNMAIMLDPGDPDAYFAKAAVCQESGDPQAALRTYEDFIRIARPQHAELVRQADERIAQLQGLAAERGSR